MKGIDFSKAPCIYWSNVTKISYLQRRVLVYSMAYYMYDESIVDDFKYDDISKQLVRMQKEFRDDAEHSSYWYAFKDFNGSTGFDLPHKLTSEDFEHLLSIVNFIIKIKKEDD